MQHIFGTDNMFSFCKCLHEQAYLTPPPSVFVMIASGHRREGLHSNNAFEQCACLPTCQLAAPHKSRAIQCSGVGLQPGELFVVIVSSEAIDPCI